MTEGMYWLEINVCEKSVQSLSLFDSAHIARHFSPTMGLDIDLSTTCCCSGVPISALSR